MSGRNFTAEEAKAERVRRMGEPLGVVFDALWQDVVWLHVKWEEYVELYGKRQSRVEILNRSAPLFFRVVQDVLWADTLLHIARLTDEPNSYGKPKLTIKTLPPLIADYNGRATVNKLVNAALLTTAFARDWRNRWIAHTDLALATERASAVPLEGASRLKVKDTVAAIADVLREVERQHGGGDLMFSPVGSATGGERLLRLVDAGLKAEAERFERRRNGTAQREDWEPPEI
ncbi:hypothetical protein [Reyranella sp. CPCC 100927]|uniref:AbiU2 domain-containing protein n=1 Tax=Reyranella sp. CPCC 100927 TaxID=2599616 RepID=UPI0011B6EB11|nr:hypothetical protein [Reyranella sp. CPCC 100927]TWT10640.1 hypothetical protein FQU96_16100 [Reyranella sp. CPCC 100927]